MNEMSPELAAAVRRYIRYARLLADAADDLEELLPLEPAPTRRGGRPRVAPTPEQEREVVRLRHANGRLGLRDIGARVGLSWRVVQRVLDEHAASQNPPVSSQNSSGAEPPDESSNGRRKGGDH